MAQSVDFDILCFYNVGDFCLEEEMKDEEKLKKALLRKATGYDACEITEEFSVENGVETLSKKKVTKKHFTPDLTALKLLIDKFYPSFDLDLKSMTDEELLLEKNRILKLLEDEQNAN